MVCGMTATQTDWLRADRGRRRVGIGIEVHNSIGSTNDRAKRLLDEPGGEGRAVVAEEQTAGRGRRGREWLTPAGRNLAVSVALRPRLDAADAWQLAAAAALAARGACRLHADVWLKWPNDLVAADGRKLGGLLIETTVDGERITSAVIGVGINVNWERATMPAELAATATSLAALAGALVDRAALLDRLLDELDAEMVGLEAGRSPLERYRAACATLGSDVEVETPAGRLAGRAVDVDEHGTLVLATHAGPVSVSSGEIVRVRSGSPA
jgi:BirA family biotin operon repressor/biotin-[acetyl-CoA-carboxylase] ligase